MDWIKSNIAKFLEAKLVRNSELHLTLANPLELDRLIINKSPGGWSIDKAVSEALLRILIDFRVQKVVEIGAGYSSIVFHYGLAKEGKPYRVYSIEENVDWFKIPSDLKSVVSMKNMHFMTGSLNFVFGYFGIHARYRIPERKNISDEIDLVFIDGPPYYFGREGGLDEIYSKLKPGCLIVLDDAERYTEQCAIYKWLKTYHGLELIFFQKKFGDKGLAILQVKSALKRRFTISAFALGLMQGSKRLANSKKIKEKQVFLATQ